MDIVADSPVTEQLASGPTAGLGSRSFLALLATQFLVALNDNMFRWLIVPIGKDLIGQDDALALGGALFLLPFVAFAAPAGYFADRFGKRTVIVGCKVAEIVIMILGVLAILSGSIVFMLAVLFLMGTQSALFSPAKYGSIPEIVRHDRISAANGWIGMTTMLAVILGAIAGGYLYDATTVHAVGEPMGQAAEPGQFRWWISASALIGVALVGWLASLFLKPLPAANPARPAPWNIAAQTYRDLGALVAMRPLLIAGLGSAYFWSLGLLAQLNIDKLARPELAVEQRYVGFLLATLTLGIGVGSVLAGWWSRGHVELGLVPLGAAGISLALILMATVPPGDGQPFSSPYLWACLWLVMLGLAAGLYDIPLVAFMQDRAPPDSRGRVFAAYNLLTFSGMLLMSGVFWLLAGKETLDLSARQIFLLCGLTTLGVMAVSIWLVPLAAMRVVFGLLIRVLYRVRVYGLEHVPRNGGAILVCNHVSWLDGLLFGYCCPRRLHLVADIENLRSPIVQRLAKDGGTVQFSPTNRRSVIQAVRAVRELLHQGRLVGIFAEGGISRTGQITDFNAGFVTMLRGTGAPVIPVSLYGLWGSILSFERGRFFTKWPYLRRLRISVDFGEPIFEPRDVQTVRLAVQQLATGAALRPRHQPLAVARQMLRNCRRRRNFKLADSDGQRLTSRQLLQQAMLLRRVLRRHVLADDQDRVGILIPPSVPAALANAALALDRRVTVNLDVTLAPDMLQRCLQKSAVRHAITTRSLQPTLAEQNPSCSFHCLEDLEAQATRFDRLVVGCQVYLLPARLLERILGLHRIGCDDVLTILVCQQSAEQPCEVPLTQRNVASSLESWTGALQIHDRELLLGVLPFSRADGFTLTLWSSLARGHRCVFHAQPADYHEAGLLAREHAATILLATPELLAAYADYVHPEHFASLRMVMVDGCQLPTALAERFETRFGIRPYAGFGADQLAGFASTNVPPTRVPGWQTTWREGSVGWPLHGVTARIVDPESGADLGVDSEGLLLIAGPNVAPGCTDHNQPIASRCANDLGSDSHDHPREQKASPASPLAWFNTGLRARIDDDGFLWIEE